MLLRLRESPSLVLGNLLALSNLFGHGFNATVATGLRVTSLFAIRTKQWMDPPV